MAGPFKWRGVSFRVRPSSALTPAREAPASDYQQYLRDTQASMLPAGRSASQSPYSPSTGVRLYDSWMNPNNGGFQSPVFGPQPNNNTPTEERAGNYYQDVAADFAAQWQAAMAGGGFGALPRDQELLDAEFALRQKEAQLAQAEIDGDLAEVNRLKQEIAANKAILTQYSSDTRGLAEPQFELALRFAKEINERNAPVVANNTAQLMGDTIGAYDKAGDTTEATANLIQSGDAALQAALEIAGADQDLYLQNAFNRGQHSRNKIGFIEDRGVANTEHIAATFRRQMSESDAMDQQHWEEEDRAIAEMFDDIANRQKRLDIDKERDRIQKEQAQRALFPEAEFTPTSRLDYGRRAAFDWLAQQTDQFDPARQDYILSAFGSEQLWGLIGQAGGDMSPDAIRELLTTRPQNDEGEELPSWAEELGLRAAEINLIANAFGIFSGAVDQFDSSAESGNFSSWTGRGGQAPSNRAHADDTEGAYAARANYVEQVAPQIMEAYGLSNGGGQWRSLNDQGRPGTSDNSDHYSGGAYDFIGSQSAMEAAARDLVNHPAVAGVRIHGNPPHLHVSFNIDYFS